MSYELNIYLCFKKLPKTTLKDSENFSEGFEPHPHRFMLKFAVAVLFHADFFRKGALTPASFTPFFD